MTGPAVCVLIDYQNIHLTAHGLYAPVGSPKHDYLIDPLRFAQKVVSVREQRQRDPRQQNATLADVRVFRGQPSNRHEPFLALPEMECR